MGGSSLHAGVETGYILFEAFKGASLFATDNQNDA